MDTKACLKATLWRIWSPTLMLLVLAAVALLVGCDPGPTTWK